MKKLLTLILALVMVFSLSVPAMAEDGDGTDDTTAPVLDDNGDSADAPVTGTYTPLADANEVYSVDIAWGSMAFTYDAGKFLTVWNPETHQYDKTPVENNVAKWTYDKDANVVTVTNRSNLAVNVVVVASISDAYKPATDGGKGVTVTVGNPSFTLGSAAEGATYDEPGTADSQQATITLSGALAQDAATEQGTVIGGITTYITSTPFDAILTDSTVASTSLSCESEENPGTAENPYLIQSAADLLYLCDNTSLQNNFGGIYFKLTTDIMVTASTWKPIAGFKGTFDGGNHTISGTLACTDYAGVFSSLYGTVENLTVSATVSTSWTVDLWMGGIASNTYLGSTISNCTFSGTIEQPNTEAGCNAVIGGIAGVCYGSITDCFNTGIVNGPDIQAGTNEYEAYHTVAYVGGIAGIVAGTGSVTGCTHSGDIIQGNNDVGGTSVYYGSIVGELYNGTVCSCNKATTNLELNKIGSGEVTDCTGHETTE